MLQTSAPFHMRVVDAFITYQGVDEMDCSSKSNDSRKFLDCRRPSPVSVLEHSFSTESSISLDSADSCITEGKGNAFLILKLHVLFSFSLSELSKGSALYQLMSRKLK